MKVRELIAALDTLTAGRTQNLDLDVLVRASYGEDNDELLIGSDITLRLEEGCDDEETLFFDVSNEDQQMGEVIGEFVRDADMDTIPSPAPVPDVKPKRRRARSRDHLRVVK